MSDEINVVSRTQIVMVEPTSGSVSIINAGPQGPAGSGGGGGSHYEDLFGFGYDATGPSVYDPPAPTSFPVGSDWTVGPWITASYPYWYSLEEGGGGRIIQILGVGDPDIAPPDIPFGTEPGSSFFMFETEQDNYGYAFNFFEIFARDHDGTYADIWFEQDIISGNVSINQFLLESQKVGDAGSYCRIILEADGSGASIVINGKDNQTNALLTASSEKVGQFQTTVLQVIPFNTTNAGVHMGYQTSAPSFVANQMFVPWINEVDDVLTLKSKYTDGSDNDFQILDTGHLSKFGDNISFHSTGNMTIDALGAYLSIGTQDFATPTRLMGDPLMFNARYTAPANADMQGWVGTTNAIGVVGVWIDASGNNLKFKVLYEDGTTFKTGTVALT